MQRQTPTQPRKLDLVSFHIYEDWLTRQIRTTKHFPNTHRVTKDTVRLTRELLMRTILELHFTGRYEGEPELYHDEATQSYIETDGKTEQRLTKQEHRRVYKTLEYLRKQTNQK